ncbi:hypothetical protein ARMGADRAFT_1037245 [Armillaria gallica]|uniref:Uncharacterized protein n=1 Tax=Armillaria gallica TaxID=47427 RepID=A0A2H3D0M5_ARMGA|nr:hypothetical protein ARMGADRAFT_1037245 [Armillaria gallica]
MVALRYYSAVLWNGQIVAKALAAMKAYTGLRLGSERLMHWLVAGKKFAQWQLCCHQLMFSLTQAAKKTTQQGQYSPNGTSTNIVTKNAIRHVGDTVPTILSLMSQHQLRKQVKVVVRIRMLEKAVINVARTYHMLASLHFPKTLYHLTKTYFLSLSKPLLSKTWANWALRQLTQPQAHQYSTIPALECPELKTKERLGFPKVDLAPQGLTNDKLHQTHAEHLSFKLQASS